MNYFWTQEPTNYFRETVQVYKYGGCSPVTISYTSTGRGEFSADGGWICREQPDGRDRRLTVVTTNGDTFDITRRRGGGYFMNSSGYWINDQGRKYSGF